MWNTLKTFVLLAGLAALFGACGYWLGGPAGMAVALALAVALNLVVWWNADRIVLDIYDAKPAQGGPLEEIVRILAQEAGLPQPSVYIAEISQPNAFATGRDPRHAAIVVTRGLIDVLNYNELRAVLGHELAHIRNRDTLTMTIAASLAGALSTLAHFSLLFGARNRHKHAGLVSVLLMTLLAPLVAMLVQLAISRTREYAADRYSAELTGEPLVLAHALQKLDNASAEIPNYIADQNPGTAHLFVVDPLSSGAIGALFATHPRVEDRIKALRHLAEATFSEEIAGTVG